MIVDSSASATDSEEKSKGGQNAPRDRETDTGSQQSPRESDTLPKDVLFSLLSTERRRRVLKYMADHGTETTLSDLADHIAAKENDTEIRLLSSQERKRVYVALYQCHLPKMDDANVIDFDHSRGTVELRPEANQLFVHLDIARSPGSDDTSETASSTAEPGVPLHEKLAEWIS